MVLRVDSTQSPNAFDENENEEEMAMEKSELSHEGLAEDKKFRKKMFFRFETKLDIPDRNRLGNLGF